MTFILNTTFHILVSLKEEILVWLEESFVSTAVRHEVFHSPQIARVMTTVEEGAESYAVQIKTEDLVKGEEWLASEGFHLFETLRKKYGENVLFFSTWLEIVK